MEWYIKWLYAWWTLVLQDGWVDVLLWALGTNQTTAEGRFTLNLSKRFVHEYKRQMCSFALAIIPLSKYEERQCQAERKKETEKARVTRMCNENVRAGNGWVWHKWREKGGGQSRNSGQILTWWLVSHEANLSWLDPLFLKLCSDLSTQRHH